MVENFINYKGMDMMSQYPDWTSANHISSVRKTGDSDVRARKHMLCIPWEMVPCQGNHVLMETPVVGQHKLRRGAREQREEEAEMEMYIYLCHLLFLLSSLKCHGCLCHIYSVCPWHFMPFKKPLHLYCSGVSKCGNKHTFHPTCWVCISFIK